MISYCKLVEFTYGELRGGCVHDEKKTLDWNVAQKWNKQSRNNIVRATIEKEDGRYNTSPIKYFDPEKTFVITKVIGSPEYEDYSVFIFKENKEGS